MRAVVFDLWGTLVPLPESGRERYFREFAEALGAPLDALSEAWATTYAEREASDLREHVRALCRTLGVTVGDEALENAYAGRRAAAEAVFAPRDDAEETLRRVRAAGYATGLVTNCTSEIPELWEASPLASLVDAALFSCVERLVKPDPRLYRRAAERLGVDSEECLFVGDGANDELAGAAAVGMKPVLFVAADTRPPAWDGATIERLRDLPAQLA